ncbi:MAG: orotidine-5'-phosphate decarboxylase [Betaproteobacteria bacterium]|nr:MAG: orotidine-5'-phosphate decarboxylase [Betaproteobacteria bacterium]
MMDSRIIVALDFPDAESAQACAKLLSPQSCKLKVGKELFTAEGPAFVETLVRRGFDVFLDLKFHDIPNTVSRACSAAANLGVWMLNVHALGGAAMMQAARDALGQGDDRALLVAVTVLTSLSDSDLQQIGIQESAAQAALRLAALAQVSGADGVVCSAHEATSIRDRFGDAFLRVTPGIRLTDDSADENKPDENKPDDQKRIMTPSRAVQNGASYLVVGRPVTRASDPPAVLRRIEQELTETGDIH